MPAPCTGRSRNDTSIKALTAAVVVGAQLASILAASAAADERDPFRGLVAANVVIILDVSGSMAGTVPSHAYVSAKRYPVARRCHSVTRTSKAATAQPCSPGAIFNGSTSVRVADSLAGVTGSGSDAARLALAESGHWSGALRGAQVSLYTGNYLNYLVAPCAGGGACPDSKVTVAKRAVSAVLDTVRGVRFGIMTFHYGANGVRGARVVAPVGGTPAAISGALHALAPARDAPLGDALYDAGQYFKGELLLNGTTFSSPIQLECETNHVVIITDGAHISGARSLAAEATLRRQQDHAPSLPDVQRVRVHTIGFGGTVNTAASTSDRALSELRQAAENAGGVFVHAATATELETALRHTLARITEATYTLTNPVLPAGPTGGRRAYLAAFQPAASARLWRGSLRAYQRDATGGVPVDVNGVPLASALVWDAGRALNGMSAANRTIYTEIGGRLSPFTRSNSAITSTMLGVAGVAERNRVIDFVRGVDVNDENGNRSTTDERPWKLGAIIHSTPVLVSRPSLAVGDPSYRAFKAAQASRLQILLAGANDGMLHAFREKDGVEIWAFIPPDMLDRLRALQTADEGSGDFVDGSPIAADIRVAGAWRTIVVFGARRGGAVYYALDITDTSNPRFLWRFADSRIQQTWSQPAVGRVKIGNIERNVAFVGGGRASSDAAVGNTLIALDLATGSKVWEYAGEPAATDDRQHMTAGIAASPTAIDTDDDGYVDRVYVGDLAGQLWKFDVSASDVGGWKGKRLFAARSGSAVHAAPAAALDRQRHLWLFFGTGDASEPGATAVGRFYALKDDTDMTNGASLTDASPGIKDVTSATVFASQGWYVVLGGRAEIPVGAASVFNDTVLFSTFTPDRTGACGAASGMTRLYALQAWSGYARLDFTTGSPLTAPTAASVRFKEIGRGIGSAPVVVLTPPIAPGSAATASVIVGTSRQSVLSTPIPAPQFLKQVRSWRER